jgi:hypothetical protein
MPESSVPCTCVACARAGKHVVAIAAMAAIASLRLNRQIAACSPHAGRKIIGILFHDYDP